MPQTHGFLAAEAASSQDLLGPRDATEISSLCDHRGGYPSPFVLTRLERHEDMRRAAHQCGGRSHTWLAI